MGMSKPLPPKARKLRTALSGPMSAQRRGVQLMTVQFPPLLPRALLPTDDSGYQC